MGRPTVLVFFVLLHSASHLDARCLCLPITSEGEAWCDAHISDDALRNLLRERSPKFLEGSVGRGLPLDISPSTFRFEIWPRVAEKCAAFETGAGLKIASDDLLSIAADDDEDPRAREMALWLLGARIIKKADAGRPASALRLLPVTSEGAPRLAESLALFLRSGDRVTRFACVVVIGACAGPDSAPTLAQVIKGPLLPEREAACLAIGRFGIEGLGADGLGLLRPPLYDRPDPSLVQAATHALLIAGTVEFERTGTTTAIDELIRALRYAPHAGEALDRKDFGGWGPGKEHVVGFTAEQIASGAKDDAIVRTCAASALSRLDIHELQHRAMEPMLRAMGDNEVSVVSSAFRFLDRVGVRAIEWGAGPPLEKLLRAPDPMLSWQAAWTVAQWGERMEPYVPLLIAETDARLARRADVFSYVWALGNSGDARAAEYLSRLKGRIGPDTRPLDDEGNVFNNDGQLKGLIEEGLERIRQVREIKEGHDAAAQEKALGEALAQRRRRYVVPTLLDVIRDGSRTVALRARCAEALRRIDPVAAPAWFAKMLESETDIPDELRRVLEQGPEERREDE